MTYDCDGWVSTYESDGMHFNEDGSPRMWLGARGCGFRGRLEHQGRWFCAIHHPPSADARLVASRGKQTARLEYEKLITRLGADAV